MVNTQMAEGIRVATVRRGVDPRRFTLLGFGGADVNRASIQYDYEDLTALQQADEKRTADARWNDCLKHMLADESHHRDVNHTFATLPRDAENPFIKDHMRDFDRAATAHALSKLERRGSLDQLQ